MIAKDFGKVGEIDIAAIAYFTDTDLPESIVYQKNERQSSFYALQPAGRNEFPERIDNGCGRFQRDGRPDLLIGNALTEKGGHIIGAPFAIQQTWPRRDLT